MRSYEVCVGGEIRRVNADGYSLSWNNYFQFHKNPENTENSGTERRVVAEFAADKTSSIVNLSEE